MFDAILTLGSTFMFLQSCIGAYTAPREMAKLVEYSSALRYQAESITTSGQCFIGSRGVPCHLITAGCNIHYMLDWVILFPIFYGTSLLAMLFYGISLSYMEDIEKLDEMPHRHFKGFVKFTTFLLGSSSIIGLAASGFGLAMLVAPMTGPAVLKGMNVYVGWAEMMTIGLTIGQMAVTLKFFNATRRILADSEGGIALVSATADAKQLVEKLEC